MTTEQFEKASEIMQTINGCESIALEIRSIILNKMDYQGATTKARFKLDVLQENLTSMINRHFEEIAWKAKQELQKI